MKKALTVMAMAIALAMGAMVPAVASHTDTVTPGAFCAVDHQDTYGRTASGDWMRCTDTDTDQALRWRASSAPDNEPEPLTCETFSDVCTTTHQHAIVAIAERGITGGFVDGTFRPAANVTRGQMATLLAASLDLEPGSADAFSDVAGNTHESAIGALRESGITSGFSDGTFRPNQSVSRGQMATFLATGFDLDTSDIVRFSDVSGTTHAQNINALATAGIAGGHSDNTYRPGNPVQRGHMATFLARSLDLIERATPPAEYVQPKPAPAPTPIVDPVPAPNFGSYTSVAAYEADVYDTVDTILGTSTADGMFDDVFMVYDMWNSYWISDAEFREFMVLWVEVLDTHIDHFAVRTPPSTHAQSFGHFTNGMDDFRVGGVALGQCACDRAWDAFEAGLTKWEHMLATWPGSFSVASVPDDEGSELLERITELRELRDRELAS